MRTCGCSNKFYQEEFIQPIFSKCRSWVKLHACWSIVEIHNGRNNMGRLTFPTRNRKSFIHPNFIFVVPVVSVFSILPIRSPAQVGSLYQVHQTLTLGWVVAIVIRRDDVAILIKNKLVRVSDARCKYLKISTIWIRANQNTFVGIFKSFAIHRSDVCSNIANLPINFAIRTFGNSAHSMATKANMHSISVAN